MMTNKIYSLKKKPTVIENLHLKRKTNQRIGNLLQSREYAIYMCNAFIYIIPHHPVLQYNTKDQGQGYHSYHHKDFGDLEELLYTGLVDWILRAYTMFLYHISHNLLQFLPREKSFID